MDRMKGGGGTLLSERNGDFHGKRSRSQLAPGRSLLRFSDGHAAVMQH